MMNAKSNHIIENEVSRLTGLSRREVLRLGFGAVGAVGAASLAPLAHATTSTPSGRPSPRA